MLFCPFSPFGATTSEEDKVSDGLGLVQFWLWTIASVALEGFSSTDFGVHRLGFPEVQGRTTHFETNPAFTLSGSFGL